MSLLLGGCSGGAAKPREAAKALAAKLHTAPRAPATTGLPKAARGERLVIDGSQSMAGFVACGADASAFDLTLDRIAADLGLTTVVRFGGDDGGELESVPVSGSLHCPEFYAATQNADHRLLEEIQRDLSSDVHLYVTDGVSSDAMLTQSATIRAFSGWIERGGSVAVLAKRSRFDGRLWSEQTKRWIGRARVSSRPYYVVILSRSPKRLEETLARLSPEVRTNESLLVFGAPTARCAYTPGRVAVQTKNDSLAWLMLTTKSSETAAGSGVEIWRHGCAQGPGTPYRAVRPRVDSIGFYAWNGTDYVRQSELPTGARITIEPMRDTTDRSVVKAILPKVQGTRFGFYALHVTDRDVELRAMADSLSTDSDATEASFSRTYRIKWLLEQLARADRRVLGNPSVLTITTAN